MSFWLVAVLMPAAAVVYSVATAPSESEKVLQPLVSPSRKLLHWSSRTRPGVDRTRPPTAHDPDVVKLHLRDRIVALRVCAASVELVSDPVSTSCPPAERTLHSTTTSQQVTAHQPTFRSSGAPLRPRLSDAVL
jgi:hypothetical protein